MRVTSMVPNVQYNIQQNEQAVNTALQQLSTGKRVLQISDDPSASANMVRSLASSANVDRYTSNTTNVLARLQSADSSLSSVITSLNQAVTLGTEGANGTVNSTNRQQIAAQVQGVLTSVIGQANTSYQGSYIFAGTASDTPPFVADSTSPTGYTYVGNSGVNQAQVGDTMMVNTNTPGDQIFTSGANVIGSLSKLVTALQSGTTDDIAQATAAVTNALNYVNQQRVPMDNSVTQLQTQETYLGQETVSLTSQQTSLVGIDTATAATNVTQAETAQNAVYAAAAKVLPQSLLNYLQ